MIFFLLLENFILNIPAAEDDDKYCIVSCIIVHVKIKLGIRMKKKNKIKITNIQGGRWTK